MAKQAGATDEEIAQAGLTRHWSAVPKGLQIDFETFKSEFGVVDTRRSRVGP
jgi:hypothetical protein